jgi:hypothetical protein
MLLTKENISNNKGLIFNIACVIYFFTIGPFVTNAVIQANREEKAMPILSIMLIVLMFAETFALNKKLWHLILSLKEIPKNSNLLIGVLWFMHLLLHFLMLAVIASLLGFEFEGDSRRDDFAAIMALAIIGKEIVLLFYLPFSARVKKYKADKTDKLSTTYFAYDIVLFLFSCLAYSAIIDTILYNSEIDRERIFLQLIAFIILCSVLYLPMRFAYFYEELIRVKVLRDSMMIIGSFVLMLLSIYLSKFIIPMLFN